MPALGDFFRLDLPGAFIDPWDTWLQHGLMQAKASLGAGWDDCYLSAPIWRFSLASGIAGPHAVSGVLMASVDRVGRQFPLTLAAISPKGQPALDHFANANMFDALEQLALDALDDGMTRDLLRDRLGEIHFTENNRAKPVVHAGGMTLKSSSDLAPALAAEHVTAQRSNPCLWSATLDDGNYLMVTENLPNAQQMQGLFCLDTPIWAPQTAEVTG